MAQLIVAVPIGVVKPGVGDGAAYARLQVDGFTGHLLRSELARVRHPARLRTFHAAPLSPRLEVLGFGDGAWILDPLDHLGHCHEVYVIVALKDLVDPV